MTSTQVTPGLDPIEALALPARARLSERITKRLIDKYAKDKDLDAKSVRAIGGATVVGILRPETIQVPAYRDDDRQVGDIPIIQVRLAEKASPAERRRVAELFFRALPRPVVLFLLPAGGAPVLDVALTHVSRTDPERSTSVIDSTVSVPLADLPDGAVRLSALDRTNLWALYQDLVRRAAGVTRPDLSADEAVAARDRIASLQAELDAVVREARREKGANARIKLNARARSLRAQIAELSEVHR